MPKSSLGSLATQEIRSALAELKGSRLKAEVTRLAAHYSCSESRIYEVTRDVRSRRKQRADKGRRRADLVAHDGLRHAAELVVVHKLDPDLAIETVRLNGGEIPVSQATFQRYLRERGLSRKQRASNVRPFRRFEADAPGAMYQFDISGVKTRWFDLKTRRLLYVPETEVSKNHPNKVLTRVPLWKFTLVDDHSRYHFIRFIPCPKPNSVHVIEFLLNAFREMGVPLALYTDNDAIIVSRSMKRAASILDRAFESSGGFKLQQHLPGNPQATGKVERAHQQIEKWEKLFSQFSEPPTLAEVDQLARGICDRVNWKVHRTTGEQPMLRFRSTFAVMRVPPPALLDSAFKAREFEVKINADLTVSFNGARYQLPRGAQFPFRNWHGERVTVVHAPDADYFVLLGLDGNEYEIEMKAATADTAGEHKGVAESEAQRTVKALKASDAERRKARTARPRLPLVDTTDDASQRPAMMPRRQEELKEELLADLARGAVAPSRSVGRLVTYVRAVEQFQREGLLPTPLSPSDAKWLKVVFGAHEQRLDSELRAEIEAHHAAQERGAVAQIQRRA